jgi:hypothetical protein
MKNFRLVAIVIFSLIVISLATMTNAFATKGWTKSDRLPPIRHTANNPTITVTLPKNIEKSILMNKS